MNQKSFTMKTTGHAASAATRFTIAIVEEDETMAETLASWVRELGHCAVRFASGAELLASVRTSEFSLFLLDWRLPDIEGIDLVRQLRAAGRIDSSIILCIARGSEPDIVEALTVGADDFIVKPLRRHELVARVGATLRRAHPRPVENALLTVPPFSIDLTNRLFRVDGQPIRLQNREYALALMLFRNLNDVVPRARIIQSLWGNEPVETSRSLDTHISRIRRKLGLAAERGFIIQSVYGLGYRMQVVAMPPLEAGCNSPA